MRPFRGGFTLVEMMVVLLIVALVSAVTLPTVVSSFSHRQVSESARLLQSVIEGQRDAAIRANAPRGIRLLPDPVFLGSSAAVGVPLAYNRILLLEPAADYTEGRVSILDPVSFPNPTAAQVPIPYSSPAAPWPVQALRIEECRYDPAGLLPNARTSWFWNVRVGEKIRIGATGRLYTIVGPMNVLPGAGNPEGFVNIGPLSDVSPLKRDYGTHTNQDVEFLYVTNGEDDNQSGEADEGWITYKGWNGVDDDGDGNIDETTGGPPFDRDGNGVINAVDGGNIAEWEVETWVGSQASQGATNSTYTILRRPAPTQGARMIELPSNIVVDMTTWDSTRERSRLPIDPNSLYVDIMIAPNGLVLPPSFYAPAALVDSMPFYHFWLSERTDIFDPVTTAGVPYRLPMPDGTPGYDTSAAARHLKGDGRLVTLFIKNGAVLTTELVDFSGTDINAPYYQAQQGAQQAR